MESRFALRRGTPGSNRETGIQTMRIFGRVAFGLGLVAMGAAPPAMAQNTPTAEEFGAAVLQYAKTDLQEWINDPVIVFAIKEQNELHKDMNQLRINRLDFQWREADSYDPLIVDLLDRQASIIARDRRAASEGVVTEIIVMDAFGLNVAISDRTSDYFQGDEAKWLETYQIGPDAVHISELEFDESTGKVQTQVSLTVVDPDSGSPIGAVTLGIDLTKLSE